MPTVREIAEFAGVSKSTVSLVLNNKAGVSDEMRETVHEAVRQLEALQVDDSLQRDILQDADTDAKSQQLTVMVLHPPVLRSSDVFSQVLQGFESAADIYNVQLRLVVNDRELSAQHVSYLYVTDAHLRPDGVLIFGAERDEPLLEEVIAQGIPCVVLGREANTYAVSGIARDEKHHAYQLTEHLIALGHRAIGFVGGSERYDFTHNRLAGYKSALHDAEIVVESAWVCLGNGAPATKRLLDHCQDVTAIMYVNDSYAAEGLPVLSARDIAIPQDLSVVSFDNTTLAQQHTPAITSIAYDHFKEGQWAVKLLLDQIKHPFIEQSHIVCRGQLIVRDSTAAPHPATASAN